MARAEAVTSFDVISDDGAERYGWIVPLNTDKDRWMALSLDQLWPRVIGHYDTPNEAFKALMETERNATLEASTDEP